jgi:peptidoglycan/LPS O-acetylase OafA/YrhL
VYRPDVDGLRAIAVIAVLLFHAGIPSFQGGFVGVDVFFVISGYLISRQILLGMQAKTFSLSDFYVRRVRRLLPAALTTIVMTLVGASIVLPPYQVAELSREAAFAAFSLSNVYFWRNSGYWAAESQTMPLLHTWTLAVEEQFYLVWPVFLMLALLVMKKRLVWLLLALTVGSVLVTANAPYLFTNYAPSVESGAAAAFYLTPFRAYEFGIGALCVGASRLPWNSMPTPLRQGSTLVGLLMITVSVLTYSEEWPMFPGWAALVPCVGAGLVIAAGSQAGVGRLLNNPVMVQVGLLSYSLYLVHWPVLAIARAVQGSLTSVETVACLAIAAVVAVLQYRLVETRFRLHGTVTEAGRAAAPSGRPGFLRRAAPVLSAGVAVAAASVGLGSWMSSPDRYPVQVRPLLSLDQAAINEERGSSTEELCRERVATTICGAPASDRPNILVIGDSIGQDGLNIAQTVWPEANMLIAARPGCSGLSRPGDDPAPECRAYEHQRSADVSSIAGRLDLIILSTRLSAERLEAVGALVDDLALYGAEVAVLGLGPSYDKAVWQVALDLGEPAALPATLYERLEVAEETNEALRRVVEAHGGTYLDRWAWSCGSASCRSSATGSIAELVVYDRLHLTRTGAQAVGRYLADRPEVRQLDGAMMGSRLR